MLSSTDNLFELIRFLLEPLVVEMGCSGKLVMSFLEAVSQCYFMVPFHSTMHAVDVANSFTFLLRHSTLFDNFYTFQNNFVKI